MPPGGLLAGLSQDPAADRDDHGVLLGERDERVRRNHTAFWVGPADQRLDTRHDLRLEVERRLVKEIKLLVGECVAEVGF
jgi:hypothetical protein